MTRFASSPNQTAGAARAVRMALAVDLDFASGHVRVAEGHGQLTIGGNTYTGLGHLGSVEVIEESVEVVAHPLTLVLSGVDNSLLATARDEVYQNRTATLYLCLFDDNGALIDTPETLGDWRMDQMAITLGPSEGTIRLNCESRLRREPRIARYTDPDQQLAYSGDRFFDLVGKIPGFRGTWGAKGAANDGTLVPGVVVTPPGRRGQIPS